MMYLMRTKKIVLRIKFKHLNILKCHIDPSYEIQHYMKGHTGASMSMGAGTIHAKFIKKNVTSKSVPNPNSWWYMTEWLRYCGQFISLRIKETKWMMQSSTRITIVTCYWIKMELHTSARVPSTLTCTTILFPIKWKRDNLGWITNQPNTWQQNFHKTAASKFVCQVTRQHHGYSKVIRRKFWK